MHFNPPSSCVLEISVRGVKIGVKADDSQEAKVTPTAPSPSRLSLLCPLQADDHPLLLFLLQGNKCSHFFQLKNISFCGYHPKNNK